MLLQGQNADKRVLSIYAHDSHNVDYVKQLQLLADDHDGLNERDIEIHNIILTDKTRSIFKTNQVTSDFLVVLIGKDGGEKYRSTQPVTVQKLYSVIDKMPMRQDEIRNRKQRSSRQ